MDARSGLSINILCIRANFNTLSKIYDETFYENVAAKSC